VHITPRGLHHPAHIHLPERTPQNPVSNVSLFSFFKDLFIYSFYVREYTVAVQMVGAFMWLLGIEFLGPLPTWSAPLAPVNSTCSVPAPCGPEIYLLL
jgi:hypothetical protein